jgi:CheY-like chemotaxis protein
MAKILIAEDEIVSQKTLYKVIEDMGHMAFVSPNGRHAWETLKANPDFQLLITDVSMPEMDGRELIKKVRDNDNMKDIPIIIISGVVTVSEILNLLEIGATVFLAKPVKLQEIREYIARYLNELEEKG